MFNNSVKHRSEMVGDQCSQLGGGGGGEAIVSFSQLIEKCYFPDRKCLTSLCVGESRLDPT